MSAYAIVTITYLSKSGAKKKAKAGSVFDDYREDDFDDWKERGWARAATTGEKAEAAEKAGGAEPKKKRAVKSTKTEDDLA